MPFDRPRADEQLGTDLRVGEPLTGKPGDLSLLGRELVERLGVALRAVSPVASSSRRARSANPARPIVVSISWAVRSCWRASTRRFSLRNHSP